MTRFLSILLFCACLTAQGTSYYFNSTNGNNSNPGTAVSPFASLNKFGFGGSSLAPGDNCYCAGNVGYANYLQFSGTSNAPVTITNWGTATWGLAGTPAAPALRLSGGAWLRVFGGYFTNVEYGVYGTSITNCEFGNIAVSLCTRAFFVYINSVSNYYHDLHLTNAIPDNSSCNDGGSGLMWMGTYSGLSDHANFNIFERIFFTRNGHHGLSLSGTSNAILNCTFPNPVWYQSQCAAPHVVGQTTLTNTVWGGGREVDSGGDLTGYNLYQSNHFSSSGFVPDCPGALQLEGEGNDVVRNNWFDQNAVAAISIYGNGQSVQQGSNNIYNNSITMCGSNYTFYTSGQLVQVLYAEYQVPIFCFGTTNNAFINNITWNNFNPIWNMFPTGTLLPAINDFRGNITNTDPLFVNGTANSILTLNANPVLFPDLHLQAGSPALGTGQPLTGITSASGTGTTFTVTNGGVFFGGLTACSRTIPADTIWIIGTSQSAQIASISGNTITTATPLTWTQGQGLALSSAPNIGAYGLLAGLTINGAGNAQTLNLNCVGAGAPMKIITQ